MARARLIGYTRPDAADLDDRVARLRASGCTKIINDPKALPKLYSRGTLVVVSISDLGRSLAELVLLVADLAERGRYVRSLEEPEFDTAAQQPVASVIAALAEYERRAFAGRVRDGMTRSAEEGLCVHRRRSLTDEQIAEGLELRRQGWSYKRIGEHLGATEMSTWRCLTGKTSLR